MVILGLAFISGFLLNTDVILPPILVIIPPQPLKKNFSSVRDGVDHLSQYQVEQDGNGDWNKYMYFTVVDKDGSVVGLLDTDKCLNDAIGNLEKS